MLIDLSTLCDRIVKHVADFVNILHGEKDHFLLFLIFIKQKADLRTEYLKICFNPSEEQF